MQIEATTVDIFDGVPGDPECCYIAIAVKRATGAKFVSVDGDQIKVEYEDATSKSWPTPDDVAEQIELFDNSRYSADPITFELPD